jgi:hypothetical protein
MHTLDCYDYLVYESVVVVLVLLDERRTAGVDEPVSSTALSSLPNGLGGGDDGVELVATPKPKLDRLACFQIVAVDVKSEIKRRKLKNWFCNTPSRIITNWCLT